MGMEPRRRNAMGKAENAEIKSAKFDEGWIIEARIGIDEFNAECFDGLETPIISLCYRRGKIY